MGARAGDAAATAAAPPGQPGPRVPRAHREGLAAFERALVLLVLAAPALYAPGLVWAATAPEAPPPWAVRAAALGLLLLVAGVALGARVPALRTVLGGEAGGARYEHLRRWTRLKTAGILLGLLEILAGFILAAALFLRLQPESPPAEAGVPYDAVLRFVTGLAVLLVLAGTVTHGFALRTPTDAARTPRQRALVAAGLAGAAVLAVLAAALTLPQAEAPLAPLTLADATLALAAGATLAVAGLFGARALPSLGSVLEGLREPPASRRYMSPEKSVAMPATMAFALLFLAILVLFVVGVGLPGLLAELPRSTPVLGLVAFLVVALVASVAAAVLLSRQEDRAFLFRVRRSAEAQKALVILLASGAVAALFFLGAATLALGQEFLGLPRRTWLDLLTFGVLAALGPYGFYVAGSNRRTRRLEERFPDFLRDLAASRNAGLTLSNAVDIASHGEYGDLTPEIVKMADQLTWNVPFEDALERFAERVPTPLIQRSVALINEAGRSGGNVTDVLMAAARDAREIKNLETERRQTIGLYAGIVYITFFVFLAVAAVLYGTFIPEFVRTATAAQAAGVANIRFGAVSLEDYRTFYYFAALMQGLGNGLVAGLMASGRVLDGLRHSFAMAAVSWVTFAFVLPLPP